MGNKQLRHLMRGAMILSVASLIAKILSAIYRVPFQNLVGDTGFYIYQQVYPIYGIGMTFALTGFPVYISKLIAEEPLEEDKIKLSQDIFIVLGVFSMIVFFGLQLGASKIALAMGDSQLDGLIKSVSFMFLFLPVLAVGRGYYQGIFEMNKTAVSQVVEQLLRVGLIILAAYIAVKNKMSLYSMGSWAMFGATVGAIGASLSFYHFFSIDFKKVTMRLDRRRLMVVTKKLFSEGLVICLFAAMMVLLQLIDSFTVKNGLVHFGYSNTAAKSLKGIYDRAQPLVQLGLVISVGFSSMLLPSLAAARRENRKRDFQRYAKMLVHVTVALSMAATVGLVALMPMVNQFLFGDQLQNETLSVYMISIFLAAVIGTYNSVLQSLGLYRTAVISLLIGLLLKMGINFYLVSVMGTVGASVATILSLLVVLIAMWIMSPSVTRQLLIDPPFMIKLTLVCVMMGIVVYLLDNQLINWVNGNRLLSGLVALVSGSIGAGIFALMAIKWQLFSIREWLSLPFGKRILKKIRR
ncbi:putative polysaccharide biosynthesis protein [Dellaglioa carnosa]|uniref:Polysaccharide biosynthesis protein n=1 Tax=Dellaglioa carnosa TaxID=2995136 RepID=A0ABT4JNQ9_9LACO|nr:polysaccharide biosynthesis protein [Dellaglioa carnosa]MCZ2492001.1 polysaccharide biosynthesis protein [Dellaglioa carnosa]MCZ2495040.1 polysaccharide biosynthesis protein [Dellaglioa carnosa]MDK1731848.1 polysaccharide biosynthesis protein [Dellaglioa carnosa]